jgi:hypothetical protein
MYTGATFTSNFSLARAVTLDQHEYSNWRFGEVRFTVEASGAPLDVAAVGQFKIGAWVAHYPFSEARATAFASDSDALGHVWRLNQNSVRMLPLDSYSDSNARQRSPDCQVGCFVPISTCVLNSCTMHDVWLVVEF